MTSSVPTPFASDAKRILVIKHGAFGDVIQAEGALRDIRENHPQAFIAVLTMPAYRAILARCPHVDETIVDERAPRWRIGRMLALKAKLRGLDFDMVYDLQNSKRTAFYFKWMLKDRRWSGTAKGCSHPHRAKDPKKIRTLDRLAGQLEDAGLTIRHTRKPDVSWLAGDASGLLAAAGVTAPYIVLVPGCSVRHPQKRWPHYAELATRLIAAGETIVTAPGPDEVELARAIPGTCIEKTNWSALAGILKGARFVIGNDTGPSHLAAHMGVAGLALFGSHMPAERTGILTENFGAIEVDDLATLSVTRVFDEVERRLAAHSNSV
ncbi:MAG: glycosyltransferase family 9 protein [Parvibaculum sp.]|nr:glycosyltransferase family 9 protein [Parvibaculum sp.]